MDRESTTVAVVGLGYVGLPLALAFGRSFKTIGFDISEKKVRAYREGFDPTAEMDKEAFRLAKMLQCTSDPRDLKRADFVVVAVPTPIDQAKRPDLTPVVGASEIVGSNMKRGAIVIYESTVYPGVTEDVCGPILEKLSGLKCGVDFKLGYSPERINPGDKEHTLERIVKVVSGQDADSMEKVAWLYGQVVEAGVYRAPSIKAAEAAKVIENTQRDLNIALMNELSIIFHKMGIDTSDVLRAAGTKWNFLPFKPGLVGGHCIGVDPYYLTYKAEMMGYHPQVILAGRRINDGMGAYVARETVKQMIASDRNVKNAKVLIMGLTFKENVADIRNSKVFDVYQELKNFGLKPVVWDPIVDKEEALHEYGIEIVDISEVEHVEAVVAAVAHKKILELDPVDLFKKCGHGAPFIDVKAAWEKEKLEKMGWRVWRL